MRWGAVVAAAMVVVGCAGGDGRPGAAFDPDGTSTGIVGSTGLDGVGPDGDATFSADDTAGDEEEDDDGGSESSGGPAFDCSPPWTPAFVGSPCETDVDCPFEGGLCLREDEGFPCGTCSMPCEEFCPDQDGAPVTFCIDAADVGLPSAGRCLSQCAPDLLGGNGCRDGYSCAPMTRYLMPDVDTGVCVPDDYATDPESDCQQVLADMGAVFVPYDQEPESPEGHPELLCVIDDPVLLYSPVGDVSIRYIESASEAPVLLGCDAAVSVVGSIAVAESLGAEELLHIGTYNCRVISGTSTLSEHGLANAIDVGGFTIDGQEITVLEHWEDGNPTPVTPEGQFLRAFTDQIWALGLWNIILTPEYNADHDNHFHIDLKEGGNTYE